MRILTAGRLFTVVAVCLGSLFLSASTAWGATATFGLAGDHSFVVPPTVTSIEVSAIGARGGGCHAHTGGLGASVTATIPVTPNQQLLVRVGGVGGGTADGGACRWFGELGGTGGGGSGGLGELGLNGAGGGAGGGGASLVGPGDPNFNQLLVVAAGGGGANPAFAGGNAGSDGGGEHGGGGGAGTLTGGGLGRDDGDSGFALTGGRGGDGADFGGGGGGGGYYGGGGGSGGDWNESVTFFGSGGGGSSFITSAATSSLPQSTTSDPASVTITYTAPVPPTATISSPEAGGNYKMGESVPTAFSCAATVDGTTIVSCSDSNGTSTTDGGNGTLDTTVPGATYTVTATDSRGVTGTTSIPYTVRPNVLIAENFDDPWPSGWTREARSQPMGTIPYWSPGGTTTFSSFNGAGNSFVAANYQATGNVGTISTWLISPQQTTLSNGDTWSFYTRKATTPPDFPDRLEVRLSTGGTCDPGNGASTVGDFTALLKSVNPNLNTGGYPTTWTQFSGELSGLPPGNSTGCLAFRYYVTNAGIHGTNGDYIGVDAIRLEEDVTPPAAPTVSPVTVPASPAPSTAPKVSGAAAPGSTVSLYDTAGCSGQALGTGPAADFNDPEVGIPADLPGNHTTQIFASAADESENISACSSLSTTFQSDSTAPTASITDAPGTYSTSAEGGFSFTGADPGGSGVASFSCSLDGATASACTSPAAYPGLDDGPHTFTVLAVDAAGNSGAETEPANWTVDTIDPVTTDDVDSGWHDAAVSVTLSATDDGSGVADTYFTKGVSPAVPTTASPVYDPGSKPELADGERIRYFSVDTAGNEGDVTTSFAARVDVTAPVTFDDVGTSWQRDPVKVTLTGTDAGSGVAAIHYTKGTSPAVPTSASLVYGAGSKPALADGEKISYFSVDSAGNQGEIRTSSAARVDTAAPVTSDDVDTNSHPDPVTVTLTGVDAGSGIAATHYTTGAAPEVPTTSSPKYSPASRPTLADGEKISYFSVDAVGNAEAPRTSSAAKVDTDPIPVPIAFAIKSAKAAGKGIKLVFTIPSAGSLQVTVARGRKITCRGKKLAAKAGTQTLSVKHCAKIKTALRKLSRKKKAKLNVTATFTAPDRKVSDETAVKVPGTRRR